LVAGWVVTWRACRVAGGVAAELAAGVAALLLAFACSTAAAQDYEREARWAQETLATLVDGEAVRIAQTSGHRFLGLWMPAKESRGALIIAHGRGWAPDHDLYGALRVSLAEAGYSTLSIQMPVLPGTAKIGDYIPTYGDAAERLDRAADWLRARGHARLAIVSHSLGATMANHYLITRAEIKVNAWVFIGIINGLEDMFRIKIPVLDVYGSRDWSVTIVGADERRKQFQKISGSQQVVVEGAEHFFEDKRNELTQIIVRFLDRVLAPA
jgi:pimeloyl-ACP methyl ester carboxylesterase